MPLQAHACIKRVLPETQHRPFSLTSNDLSSLPALALGGWTFTSRAWAHSPASSLTQSLVNDSPKSRPQLLSREWRRGGKQGRTIRGPRNQNTTRATQLRSCGPQRPSLQAQHRPGQPGTGRRGSRGLERPQWFTGPHGVVFSAEEIAVATGGTLLAAGTPGSVCTDTRRLQPGDWFLALRGDNFDGHDFIQQAHDTGCAGVIADTAPQSTHWTKGFVRVPNTLTALQGLAADVRSRFDGPVIAITGSAGKTTTRVMVGLALQSLGRVHQPLGNLNNHIGVPLTLLALPSDAAVCVLEMGMNHAGEIATLVQIARPSIRVVTNVGLAHVEGLGSLEAIARAKGEMLDGALPGDVCVINGDQDWSHVWSIPEGATIRTFGHSPECDVSVLLAASCDGGRGVNVTLGMRQGRAGGEGGNGTDLETATVEIRSPGMFLADNACAAVAVATAVGVPLTEAAGRIAGYTPVGMRFKLEDCPSSRITLINDAYNSNPLSASAAVSFLSTAECIGRRVAILGDMLELGAAAPASHLDVLRQCVSSGLDVVAVCGSQFAAAVTALKFQPDGRPHVIVEAGSEALAQACTSFLQPGDLVLVKGSRGMKMEAVCHAIKAL